MNRAKYPRTPHLPWSPGATSDDKRIPDVSGFEGRTVIVTEKMDGENTTVYPDGTCHARSMSSGAHPSRDWMRAEAARIGALMPREGDWRLCGENLFARHSIEYSRLPSYFLAFGIVSDGMFLDWTATEEWCALLDVHTVPVLYRGPWKEQIIASRFSGDSWYGGAQEGYVVRLAEAFPVEAFGASVAKYVRASHVQTDSHWMSQAIVRNGLDK